MIAYFDTTFIVKCYVRESNVDPIRRFAATVEQLVCSELAKAEFAAAIHRQRREQLLTKRESDTIIAQFEQDCAVSVWEFAPVSTAVLDRTTATFAKIPASVTLRSADAIHCATARELGLSSIYSNDRHLLAAAKHFGLTGVDLTRS